MLPARPRLGFLAEQVGERMVDRIERRDRRQSHRPATAFQRSADLGVHQRVEHQARVLRDFLQDALEMRLAAHHRPEMPQRLHIVILGERRLGDVLQRLAGGIGEEVEMKAHQWPLREARGATGDESVENMPHSH